MVENNRHAMMRTLRIVAFIEATSYLVLFAGIVWRSVLDGPDLSTSLGLTHGLIYLLYASLVLMSRTQAKWSWTVTLEILAAGVIPLGGFYVAERYLSPKRLPTG